MRGGKTLYTVSGEISSGKDGYNGMKKSDLARLRMYAGNLDTLFGVKDYTFNDGPARGMRAFDVDNGAGLQLTVLADRGMDLPFLRLRGVNMGFGGKVGLRSANLYAEDGARGFLRQFNAGILTTCGLSYAGGAGMDGERALGLHGPYSNTPAQNVRCQVEYDGDEAVIHLRGEVREACVLEENLLLTRDIYVHTQTNRVRVADSVENQGFAPSPLMLIYHINFGYPMLDEGARVYVNAGHVEPRDAFAREGMAMHDRMEAPEIGREEQCYFHTGFPSEGLAVLHNEKLGMAAAVRFDARNLPILCEWKCMRAGDYALGLEPTTSGVLSRAEARQNGTLITLAPGETYQAGFELELSHDPARIEQLCALAR